MEIVTRPASMTALSREFRAKGERIGFVPTLGALHEGHLSLIRKMVPDREMDLEIEVCPTGREEDGLAMSSRNIHLTPEERRAAPILCRALRRVESAVMKEGERHAKCVLKLIRETVATEPLVFLDYASVVGAENL